MKLFINKNSLNKNLILLGIIGCSTPLAAQGTLSVNPISTYTTDKEAVLKVNIQNLTDQAIRFELKRQCDVDGIEYTADECDQYFKVQTDAALKEKAYLVQGNDRIAITVSLAKVIKHYALYKPLIRPLVGEDGPKKGITFEFNYQPGLLFLINPADEKLTEVKFSTRTTDSGKYAGFKFDISKFNTPHVANISAKLLDRSSKKLIRFARLSEEQIIDPRRKEVNLEVEYGRKEDPAVPLCYELYIQEKSSKSGLQKLTDCAP